MLDTLASLVRTIAREEVLSRFLCVGTSCKKDGSLLSDADIAAQYAFMLGLPEIIDAPVLGEEMPASEQQSLWQQHARTGLWVVDPIDGTVNFVNGMPYFALSVAFIQNHQVQLAVTYNPISQELFSAQKGQGAFLNARRLPVKQHNKLLSEGILSLNTRHIQPLSLVQNLQTNCPCASKRTMGCSTLDWCFLAAGRFDVCVHGGQKLWDYAAGSLILAEAGGQVATLEGDDFWSGQHVWQRSVIAALQPGLFRAWLGWIRQNQ